MWMSLSRLPDEGVSVLRNLRKMRGEIRRRYDVREEYWDCFMDEMGVSSVSQEVRAIALRGVHNG
jgi:hypothetical protein